MRTGTIYPRDLLKRIFLVLSFVVTALRLAPAMAIDPNQGPGGPILVVTSASSTYGKYYAEILRTEGLNEFAVADISTVTSTTLASYDLVILAKMSLSAANVTMLTTWVNGGGRLIAMGPDAQLASLLGLTASGTTLANGYLLVDATTDVGNGIVSETMQFHGTADRYTLNGATSIATLYSDANTATSNPAVTVHSVGGSGGQAAAFTYDLATSVVYSRQGNPAWATQERDGFTPIRPDDKYFGNAASDPQQDWVNLNKVAIPQADEQQRLLANLILNMNLAKRPLPRFWYFPRGVNGAVVMTGDDHANGGTAGRFDQFIAASLAGCSVANWECVRGSSYIYPGTPLTNAQAAAYNAQGFEVGLHINTDCADFTPASLDTFYTQQISAWQTAYPSIPPPITQRHHCLAWSDWITAAQEELSKGMRLDLTYYYWPSSWVSNVPGLFVGSAMPMRYAALDGTIIDVYNATTQMTDESGQVYPYTVDTLLDRVTGPQGYYGAYAVNAHTDLANSAVANAVVQSAKSHGLPIVSSKQMLDWLDGRGASSFGALSWNGTALGFSISPGSNSTGLQAMVPRHSATGVLSALTFNGSPLAFAIRTVKGVEYAFFAAAAGNYVATYGTDASAPTVTSTSPVNGVTDASPSTVVKATFSKAMDPLTLSGSTVSLRDGGNNLVSAGVSYDSTTATAILTPATLLAANTHYTATIKGGAIDPRAKDITGNALASDFTWSFTTAAALSCPCSVWPPSATPANDTINDTQGIELGVKFKTDINGFITGIRFYKGSANTGTHIGNLWTAAGAHLATATFANETPSGWQQVNFASPVAVTANTVYVASYYAPAGHYAASSRYFADFGTDSGALHLLKDGVSGGNGVYAYGLSSLFPTSTFQATNYWVDVVFTTAPGSDTTPPTVISTTPANGASGVGTASTITATFSEAMSASTVNNLSFVLRDATNALVSATVSYDAATRTATLTHAATLAASSTYTASVLGGGTDPRVKDVAGNALAVNFNWSFSTGSLPVRNATTLTGYSTIQAAWNAAADGNTVQAQGGVYTENLQFTNPAAVRLKGGYDTSFSANAGSTVVNGSLTLTGGSVDIDNIIIQ